MDNDPPTRYWPLRVRAAYRWILGDQQQEIAEKVDRTPKTIRRWQKDETWGQALDEARDRWLTNLDRKARKRALELVEGAESFSEVIAFLERLDERLRPEPDRLEVSGPKGGPMRHRVEQPMTPEQKAARVEELLERVKSRAEASENGVSP